MNCPSLRKCVTALCSFLSATVVLALEAPDVLIVELFLNQQSVGETFVLSDDDQFYVEESTLVEWEVVKPWPDPILLHGKKYYALSEFAGTKAFFNFREMELRVSLPPSLLPLRLIDMRDNRSQSPVTNFGGYLDYEVNWLTEQRSSHQSMFGMMRPVIFGPLGNLSSNILYRNYTNETTFGGSGSQDGFTVLDLTYTKDDPTRLRSLRVGDLISNSGTIGRSLRLGGVQFATNFATQPMLITYPLPDFYGQTEVPTALDVYVNGRLTQQRDVQPGSYILESVPVVNGAGQFQVVAQDALGRQQVFTQDFYLSTDLLKQGLSDYSVSIGALREAYGLESFQYGDFAATGSWRYGLRDNLTTQGHGEFGGGVAMVSGAGQRSLKLGGTISAGLGVSNSNDGSDIRWQLGFQQITDFVSYNIEIAGAGEKFALVGGQTLLPKLQFLATAGTNLPEAGTLGMAIVRQQYYDSPTRTIVSANHSKTFRNYFSLTTYLSYVDSDENDFLAGIRFSMPFGEHHSSSGGVSNSRAGTRVDGEIRRNIPAGSGYGYHLGLSASDDNFIDAGFIAQNEYGTYSADVRQTDSAGSVWQIGTIGSVAYLGGMTQFTRQIHDAFAVVNVGDFEGVRVYSENQVIGRTNSNGQVFVPGLRPYLNNKLRIELEDLPLNVAIGKIQTETAPYYRSGVIVDFEVHTTTNVLLRALLPDGNPVPEGAIATIDHSDTVFPVGLDGQLYLQGIDRSSQIEIRWNGTSCELNLPYPDGNAIIAKLGDIRCDPESSQ